MSEPVLVRGEMSRSIYWSRILIPFCGLAAVALLLFGDRTAGILLTAVFGFIWICLEASVARLRSRQMWIRDTQDGFEVIHLKRQFHVPDDSIHALALKTRRNFSGGELKSVLRQFVVWTTAEPQPIILETTLTNKQPDPLAALTSRVWNSVLERSQSSLQAGDCLVGDNWRLDTKEFTWKKGSSEQSIPRHEISACDEFDGHICIWKKGQDDAIAKFPAGGQNVCLLPHLLRVTDQTVPAEPDDGATLGRVLFERKPRLTTRLLCYVSGFLMAFVGVCVLAATREVAAQLIGAAFMTGGGWLIIWAYSLAYTVFQCRERGVLQRGLLTHRELRYVDVGAFTYAATRHYHNGVYVGTHVGLGFVPLPEAKGQALNYRTTIMNDDEALEELRNFIAKAIAVRMGSRLSGGDVVPWTANLTFHPQGIQYRPAGLLRRKDVQLLPYAEFGGQGLDQGVFYLFRRGEKKHIMSEQVSAANFFPGYFLLLMMQQE